MKCVMLFFISFLWLNQANAQSSVAAINEKAYQEYLTANKLMNRAYNKVLSTFDENYRDAAEIKRSFIASQQAFLAYRKKEALFQDKYFQGGSMTPTFKYRALKQLTGARRKQLEFFFENF